MFTNAMVAEILTSLAIASAGAGDITAGTGPSLRAAPVNQTSPTITGKARQGETLTASQGEWAGEPTAYFYQWLRCDSSAANCEPISGASQPTYGLTGADLGARLRVEVVASNADGSSAAKQSADGGDPPLRSGLGQQACDLRRRPGRTDALGLDRRVDELADLVHL